MRLNLFSPKNPRSFGFWIVGLVVAAVGFAPQAAEAQAPFDVNKFAAELAASLAKSCPMASPGDIAAHEACREGIGTGVEARMRNDFLLFGGQQSEKRWIKDKKTDRKSVV